MKPMNDQTIENPTAFPVPSVCNANGDVQYGTDGMALRDYFAAKAMSALIASPDGDKFSADEETGAPMEVWEDFAKGAYQMADAMLKARLAQ